jgi:putative ABC transport system substrate-binding protein
MQRCEFISLLGGAAAGWPLMARAQQTPARRRVGILMPYLPTDNEYRQRVDALQLELQRLGWTRGRNIEFDERWTTNNLDLVRANAANLVELKPDVIVAIGGRVIPVLMQLTQTIPIVIPGTADPVGRKLIESLARPGGNVTGFATIEFSVIGKCLDTLKQMAPETSRVAIVYDPDDPAAEHFREQFEAAAPHLSIQPSAALIHGIADIEREIGALGRLPGSGAFFAPDITTAALRDQVTEIVARHRVPAIYTDRIFVASGGLASYDANRTEMFRQTASYVDRVLRGEKPAELPFQQPTEYQLSLNLKAAKALGLAVPFSLVASADEVIEGRCEDMLAGARTDRVG